MAEQQAGFEALEKDLEELNRLDAKALARRWRALVGGPVPAGLGRALILRILSYHLQAQRYGDLDRASRQALNDVLVRSKGRTKDDGADPRAPGRTDVLRAPQLRPGTVLSRDHGGALHRVTVMERGFSWNGKTYDSLSKVAVAITGTRWNGPRFFGLRDRNEEADRSKSAGNKADSESPIRRTAAGSKPEGRRSVQSRAPAGSLVPPQAASP